jgi:hypothetical protein
MDAVDPWIRWSIWPAIALGLAACLGWRETAAWRVSGALYLVHVVAAYHLVYRWSHAAAVADNLRQVRETIGVESGSGIYVNYMFTVAWILTAVIWHRVPPWGRILWRGAFLFIAFNGAIVFAHGAARWAGIGLFAGAAIAAGMVWKRGRQNRSTPVVPA